MTKRSPAHIPGSTRQGWTHLDGGVPLPRGRGLAHVAPEVPGLRELVFLLWHLDPGVLGLL